MKPLRQHGDEIRLHYRLALPNGDVIDSTFDEAPITFCLGDGVLSPGLESLLFDLADNEHCRFILGPGDAFGEHDPDKLQTLDRALIPADMSLTNGQLLLLDTPSGDQFQATIVEIQDQHVLLDLNHPYAGSPLVFEALIVV